MVLLLEGIFLEKEKSFIYFANFLVSVPRFGGEVATLISLREFENNVKSDVMQLILLFL